MKIASAYKEGGLETPDGRLRRKPDAHGVIDWPDSHAAYAEKAVAGGHFVILGRTYSGFGPGKWGKREETTGGNRRGQDDPDSGD